MKFTAPLSVALNDPNAEAVRKNVDQRIGEIQALPAAGLKVIRNVVLPDGVGVRVPHGLGRKPIAAWPSFIRNAASAGVIADFEASSPSGARNEQSETISLVALGFGADITVDIVVL